MTTLRARVWFRFLVHAIDGSEGSVIPLAACIVQLRCWSLQTSYEGVRGIGSRCMNGWDRRHPQINRPQA